MDKRSSFLSFYVPTIENREISEVVSVLRSGWLSSGPKKLRFEKEISEFIGTNNCVAMNSCTAVLHASLIAKGIGPGDEVITSPFTFCSTINVIIHVGAKPVLVDIDPDTLCINPELIKEKINVKTAAVIPVHYGGQPCDMDSIDSLCKKHGVFMLEDAAHALGAEYKGRKIGSLGDATAFSFYATKNLTTSEGGMLTTNDSILARKARIISTHGMNHNAWNRYGQGSSWFYDIELPGFKYNMTDIQAAIGLEQLKRFEEMQEKRKMLCAIYDEAFKSMNEVIIPKINDNTVHARHLYTIQLKQEACIDRKSFIKKLSEFNIGTSVHFIPIHYHSYYKKAFEYKKGDFPVTEGVFDKILSLPLYPKMTEEDVNYVINVIKHIIENNQ